MKISIRYYVGLLIVSFVCLVFFTGILKAVLLSCLIVVGDYFFDKFLMNKIIDPILDKFFKKAISKTKDVIEKIEEKTTT